MRDIISIGWAVRRDTNAHFAFACMAKVAQFLILYLLFVFLIFLRFFFFVVVVVAVLL